MFITSIYGETPISEIRKNNIAFEVVRCPATIWCGALKYAPNCTDEPDIGGLLQRYQEHIPVPPGFPVLGRGRLPLAVLLAGGDGSSRRI